MSQLKLKKGRGEKYRAEGGHPGYISEDIQVGTYPESTLSMTVWTDGRVWLRYSDRTAGGPTHVLYEGVLPGAEGSGESRTKSRTARRAGVR